MRSWQAEHSNLSVRLQMSQANNIPGCGVAGVFLYLFFFCVCIALYMKEQLNLHDDSQEKKKFSLPFIILIDNLKLSIFL